MLENNIERLVKKATAEAMLAGRQAGWLEGKLEGEQDGIRKGKLEGRLEGESTLFERLLTRRFGPLSDATRNRLNLATAEQLESWAERILDAKTLAEVFAEH